MKKIDLSKLSCHSMKITENMISLAEAWLMQKNSKDITLVAALNDICIENGFANIANTHFNVNSEDFCKPNTNCPIIWLIIEENLKILEKIELDNQFKCVKINDTW